MSGKFKFSLFFIFTIFLFSLIILGVLSVGKRNSVVAQFIKSLMPEKVSFILKKTVFSIPLLNQKTDKHEASINEFSGKIEELNAKIDYLTKGPGLLKSDNIKSKFNDYNLKYFQLPFPSSDKWKSRYEFGAKPVAYLEQTEKEIIIVSGHGEFFYLKKNDIKKENLSLKSIETNIKDLISDEKFYLTGPYGVRDLLIINNQILFSYTKEASDNCYNTSVMTSELNLSNLKFNELFSYDECVSKKNNKGFSVLVAGGRMVSFKDEKILLSIGSFSRYGADAIIISDGYRKQTVKYEPLAQLKDSFFGKIISIDLKTKEHELISMGSRNQQGLYYDKKKDIIIFTEHGPKGGDEININLNPDNENIENYGWPISSYGEHYDGLYREEASLHKSHKDYGFIEPIKYYAPSIAISEIISVPKSFKEEFTNDFFVSALGYKKQMEEGDQSIHHIRLSENFDKIIFQDIIPIGERIRDLIFIKEQNVVLMVLESIPALAVLNIKSF